ncbi:hypothetical protein LTR70_007631 [Exophiala xenobiotica]|uniref:Uncharacterized protein n=1 Tax=Lithohypha guttulata TaxID=1690604 RepID=A0ABR0K492_9EURO|nr:hypothetical protein LTR24_007163 [Lithohypha guttulata]KAK5313445.1 hypothetical protein LTR70_007631 [Exophiala xenobiotica]
MAPRVLRYACTRCTHLPGFDRLASKSDVAKRQSLQYHVEQEHPEVTDWIDLKRDLPRVNRSPVPATQVAKSTQRVHSQGHKALSTTTSRPSIMLRFTQRADGGEEAMEEGIPAVSDDDDTISVDINEVTTHQTMVRGSSQEQNKLNKATSEPVPQYFETSMNTSWHTTVNRERSKTVEIVSIITPEIQFDRYAREALEGKYGPQAEAIAWRAFPYSNMNMSTFGTAEADDTAIGAVRFLTWRHQRVEAELEAAQRQLDLLMRDLIAGILCGQGMTDAWIESNGDNVVEGLKKIRDEAEPEAMDTAN